MADNQESGGWHLDKRVSFGHLITTMTVVCAVIFWSSRIESRIERNELRIAQAEMGLQELRVLGGAQYQEIIRRLERIEMNSSAHLELHAKAGSHSNRQVQDSE
jgi:hypothetical protein